MGPFERSRSVYHRSQDQLGGIDDIRGVCRNGTMRIGGFECCALTAARLSGGSLDAYQP